MPHGSDTTESNAMYVWVFGATDCAVVRVSTAPNVTDTNPSMYSVWVNMSLITWWSAYVPATARGNGRVIPGAGIRSTPPGPTPRCPRSTRRGSRSLRWSG